MVVVEDMKRWGDGGRGRIGGSEGSGRGSGRGSGGIGGIGQDVCMTTSCDLVLGSGDGFRVGFACLSESLGASTLGTGRERQRGFCSDRGRLAGGIWAFLIRELEQFIVGRSLWKIFIKNYVG
jgi:hypothetical protein